MRGDRNPGGGGACAKPIRLMGEGDHKAVVACMNIRQKKQVRQNLFRHLKPKRRKRRICGLEALWDESSISLSHPPQKEARGDTAASPSSALSSPAEKEERGWRIYFPLRFPQASLFKSSAECAPICSKWTEAILNSPEGGERKKDEEERGVGKIGRKDKELSQFYFSRQGDFIAALSAVKDQRKVFHSREQMNIQNSTSN